jgi:hypothetical protein
MESKNQKIVVAIVIAAIIILAGTAFLLINQEPEPSLAERMTLTSSDMPGTGWKDFSIPYDPKIPNASSVYAHEIVNLTYTETGLTGLDVREQVIVFNSTNDSRSAFMNWRLDIEGDPGIEGCENMALGDAAVYFPMGSILGVIFVKGSVTAWLNTQGPIEQRQAYDWQRNATIDIALLQLQKIDQYLAQHPGAN